MNFHFQYDGIWLWVFMSQAQTDKFDPMTGHYTEPGQWMIDEIRHKGDDIQGLLSDETIDAVLNEFERVTNEFAF